MINLISINQKRLFELANEKHISIDFGDGAIFNYISERMLSPTTTNKMINNHTYYWIPYTKMITDLPMLNIKSKKPLYLRINKLIKLGLLEKYTDMDEGSRTYFRLTQTGTNIIKETLI